MEPHDLQRRGAARHVLLLPTTQCSLPLPRPAGAAAWAGPPGLQLGPVPTHRAAIENLVVLES